MRDMFNMTHSYVWHVWRDLFMFVTSATGWRRPIGCLIFIGHFPQKSPTISCSCVERYLQLRHPVHLRHPVLWLTRSPIKSSYFIDHFQQKSPIISGSFAERHLQLRHPRLWLTRSPIKWSGWSQHMWMSHVKHMNESCTRTHTHTYIWRSHNKQMNESCTHTQRHTHSYVRHDWFIRVL